MSKFKKAYSDVASPTTNDGARKCDTDQFGVWNLELFNEYYPSCNFIEELKKTLFSCMSRWVWNKPIQEDS